MQSNLDLSLYLVLDPPMCGGFQAALKVADEALSSGVTILQLRAPTLKKRDWFELASALKPICHHYHVPLIINDHIDVAMAVNADGVHVGQQDLPAMQVRELLGKDKIIGLSISHEDELIPEIFPFIDYIGVGPVFDTQTKQDAEPSLGFDGAKKIIQAANIPSVLIGGLKLTHVDEVKGTGTDGVCVVSAICAEENPALATAAFRLKWNS